MSTRPNGDPIRVRTEGQRLLLQVPGTIISIAKRVGTTKNTVIKWKAGAMIPGVDARAKIYHALDIHPNAWTQPPEGSARARNGNGAAAAARTDPSSSSSSSSSLSSSTDSLPTSLAQCLALLETLQRSRVAETLTAVELVKLVDAEARMVKLRASLEERAELAEDRYVREHPAWLRAKREISRVLVKFPEAARAVAEALARLGV